MGGPVRLAHAVLHRALSRALSWGKVARNVADASRIDLPRLPGREAAHLGAGEVRLPVAGTKIVVVGGLVFTTSLGRAGTRPRP